MEPRPCGRGNRLTTLRWWDSMHTASMEPRPCGRGNLISACRGFMITALQWSHDLAVVETMYDRLRRKALIRLQWSHDLAVVETTNPPLLPRPLVSCFNGATTLRSWKPGAAQGAEQAPEASMEPRPCGRGNVSTATAIPTAGEGFNGATTLRSWKPTLVGADAGDGPASMEPRPCGRGNLETRPELVDQIN